MTLFRANRLHCFYQIFFLLWFFCDVHDTAAGTQNPGKRTLTVGVAKIDITPHNPIRLSGYGDRKTESDGILQPISAKALTFGNDREGVSVLITVDLIGIPGHITSRLYERLASKIQLDTADLVICTSHTHGGPEVGTLLNHFGGPLPPDELGKIIQYQEELIARLEAVVLMSLKARRPSLLSWGTGEVNFAKNRRVIKDGKWVGGGVTPGGPVDHAFPLLRITEPNGNLRAVLVSYACHGTTLGSLNKVHGDWIGEAQKQIEEKHPGAIALVAVGCGADINPDPRYKIEHVVQYGKMIADETERLLQTDLQPLDALPVGRYKRIQLPFSHIPDVTELVEQAKGDGPKGYYARLCLEGLARGREVPRSLSYPIKTWTFGEELAMVFLAGEVVVDYALRLKDELRPDRLWINAYSNDVPSYIASRRVIREGGYEAESSQYSYDRPSPYSEEIEDLIIQAVHNLLPSTFKSIRKKEGH